MTAARLLSTGIVRAFREEVATSGVLYFTFRTMQQFEAKVRHDLTRQVQEWGKTWGGVVAERVRRAVRQTTDVDNTDTVDASGQARSITGIVFEELSRVERLPQRVDHDPEVMSRSVLEAEVILDSSPAQDDWGRRAAQQAATLVAVALAGRLEDSVSARTYVVRVCERILNLRGLQLEWRDEDVPEFFRLVAAAKEPHDDDVLRWMRQHTTN